MTKDVILTTLKKEFLSKNKISVSDLDYLMEKLGAVSYFVVNSDSETIFYDEIPSWYFPQLDTWIQVQKINLDSNNVMVLDVKIVDED